MLRLLCYITLFNVCLGPYKWVTSLRVYDPPSLQIVSKVVSETNSNGREVDVTAGVPLHIRCTGSQPIFWFYPKYLPATNLNIKTGVSQCTETRNCDSDFFIANTSFSYTGSFACHYNDSITLENSESVFIFFNDARHLIAPSSGNAVIDVLATKLSSVDIPCIPTNSKTNVTLVKAYSTVSETKRIQLKPMKVEPGSIEDFTYDPKVGFHIKREFLDGASLFCNFSLYNESQAVQVVVYFPNDPGAHSPPEIDSSLAKKVVIYGRFALNCKFEVTGNASISMNWLHPKTDESIVRVKAIKAKVISVGKHNVTIYSRKLVVTKTRPENAGWYLCRVTDSKRKSFETRKYVTVYDYTKKPFVELSNDYATNSMKTIVGESLKLTVYINAFPKVDFDGIYWLKDGKVIDSLNTERYFSNYTENEASLEITNITSQDIGFYSLKVSTEDVISENTIHVLVEGKPFISLSADNQTARRGSKHRIACHAIGYPPPSVGIFYKNCTQTCDNETNIIRLWIKEDEHLFSNEESVNIENQVNKVILTMNYMAKKSGTYICFAENKFGNEFRNHVLLVVPETSKSSSAVKGPKDNHKTTSVGHTIAYNLLHTFITFIICISFTEVLIV